METATPIFVRNEMLGPKEPPTSQRGVVKWFRENLFSTPLNSILTVIGVAFVYLVLKTVVPWVWNGVWTASSLSECRQIIAETLGPDSHAACWAMIAERWKQFIYGFYPMDSYWRPTLAFALMFVALAPVLYFGIRHINVRMVGAVGVLLMIALWGLGTDGAHIGLALVLMAALTAVAWVAPKKLVWLTLLYPAIGFFLLWGGSVWGPVGALLGFVILAFVWLGLQRQVGVVVAGGIALITAAVWWLSVQTHVTGALHAAMPIGLPPVRSDQFGGFLLAFVIGVTAIAASLPIGILLALGRRSDMFLIKTMSVGFIEFVRGVPLITMLFVASLLLQYFLPPQTNFDLILRVIILVTLFSAAYIAEVIRGGLAALPRGQYEAADALGLDYWQAQRLIIMPQALKISIPGIVSSFIGLFKDTTLVALVGLADPLQGITKIARADINWKGIYWEPYLFVGLIFFACCFSMSRYSMYLERKLKRDHR
ncbi:amino acid ABC transporter permease [Frigidibacter sp. RF13]|uniref:amino acid ABC transporter permease n=1 Tax=Frigidibacter sp. RF13 TaxID=2997340 RepID=UPI00226F5CC9|nr:amino acid ABC transporter permease [Frigidibacter sp. RF13]MCY1127443.1 amino acid ABC transporter permease [Frigidibacter sp. RF13]